MASRTRNVCRQLPADLCDLLQRLGNNGRLFNELFESKRERMQAILSELKSTYEEVKEQQRLVDGFRVFGAVSAGLGLAVGAAALLQGVSPKMVEFGCIYAVLGGASVIGANVIKASEVKKSIETVEELIREFMTVIELLKDVLERIKDVSEEFEEKTSLLMTKTGAQAHRGLSSTEQLEQFLMQAAKLAQRSREVVGVTRDMKKGVGKMLNVVTRISPTPEEDAELRKCIMDSAAQCKKTFDEFVIMKRTLEDFEEMQRE